ncbi:MAG: peptidylprolyl isomerase [Patescibacteria group bacterium]
MKEALYWFIGIVVIIGVLLFINSRGTKTSEPEVRIDTYATSTLPVTGTSTEPVVSVATSTPQKNNMHRITLETNKGTIVFETYDADAPNTVKNFVTLAQKDFYKDVIFHRVIKGFMIQGGDPTGTGRGGPGYAFADELNSATESYKKGYVRGTVAMANSGPDTNGSQFFIMHADYPLPNNYTIFGHVVSGMDVVDAIANTPTGAGDRPTSDIKILKVDVGVL